MYELSIKNINYLAGEVRKSGVTYSHLLDDLIDHVCCDVEHEMKNGLPFEKAYERVRQKVGTDGLQRIQDDTLYLIDKNFRTMKKTMRISGVLSPILMAFGALFKIMHWPTAGILLVLGFFFLVFFFLPSAIYVSYKEISNRTRKWTYIVGFLGTFFLSVSFLFKVMHWPGAAIVLLLGILLTCFVFLPALLIHKLKEAPSIVPKYVFILAFAGFILQLLGFTCKVQHWPGAGLLFLGGIILFVFIALPIYVYKKYKESKNIENSFIYIIVVLVWFIVPITLLSLNVSRNILHTNIETELIIDNDIRYLQERNNQLLKKLAENSQALKIRTEAEAFISYIQLIKADLVRLSEGDRASGVINKDNEIDVLQLSNLGTAGVCSEVLKNGRAKELVKMYEGLKEQMILASNDKNYIEILSGIIPDKMDEELFDEHADAVSSLNSLSFLQLNIMKAENAVFAELASKSVMAVLKVQPQKSLQK